MSPTLRCFKVIGCILAIMPLNLKKSRIFRKIYVLFVYLSLTIGAIVSLINRNFYNRSFFMKKLFFYMNDLILVVLNFHIIVVFNFWKQNQWTDLIEKLKFTKKIITNDNNRKNEKLALLVLILSHLIFISVETYGILVWFKTAGIDVIFKYGVRRIEEYIHFFYLLFFCYVLRLMLLKYKNLNKMITVYIKNDKFSEKVAKDMSFIVLHLKEINDGFNELFGWPIFLIIYHTIFHVLIYLFVMVTNDESSDALSAQICTVLLKMFMTTLFLLLCNQIPGEVHKTINLSYKLRWSFHFSNSSQKQEFYEFTSLIIQNIPIFTAADFFLVGKSTIIHILAIVSSTLVILLQFNNKD